jgi:hypothetical protein
VAYQAIECYGVIGDIRTAALVAPPTDARPPCRPARRSRPLGERLPVAQDVERLVDVAAQVPCPRLSAHPRELAVELPRCPMRRWF